MAVENDPSSSHTLVNHLRWVLRPYHLWIPVFASIVFSLVIALIMLMITARSDCQMLKSVESDISELIQKQDFPEITNLLRALSDEHHGHLVLLQGGDIIASSSAMPDIFYHPKVISIGFGTFVSHSYLISELALKKLSQPEPYQLHLMTPLHHLLWPVKILAIFVLFLSFCISKFYAYQISRAVDRALEPISHLQKAILNLQTLKDPEQLYKSGIQELDSIRSAILETHRALANAQDTLARMKAKELAAESYRLLIHDMEKLVKALRKQIQLVNEGNLDEATHKELLALIPETADQVVQQVSAAKANLDLEANHLYEQDIILTIRKGISDAWYSMDKNSEVQVIQMLPEYPVLIPHDSQTMRRAIANLIQNALAAAIEHVRVSVEEKEKNAIIRIEDDGPGIPDGDVGLYCQGRKKSTKADRQALGLSATSHIIKLHGGRLIYQKSQWGGASFEVVL